MTAPAKPPTPDPGYRWASCDCDEIDPSDRPCPSCAAQGKGIAPSVPPAPPAPEPMGQGCEYRQGLPSVEDVRAHEERGGWWMSRFTGCGDRSAPQVRRLFVDRLGQIRASEDAEDAYGMAPSAVAIERRPCLPDGTPCLWPGAAPAAQQAPALTPAEQESRAEAEAGIWEDNNLMRYAKGPPQAAQQAPATLCVVCDKNNASGKAWTCPCGKLSTWICAPCGAVEADPDIEPDATFCEECQSSVCAPDEPAAQQAPAMRAARMSDFLRNNPPQWPAPAAPPEAPAAGPGLTEEERREVENIREGIEHEVIRSGAEALQVIRRSERTRLLRIIDRLAPKEQP